MQGGGKQMLMMPCLLPGFDKKAAAGIKLGKGTNPSQLFLFIPLFFVDKIQRIFLECPQECLREEKKERKEIRACNTI